MRRLIGLLALLLLCLPGVGRALQPDKALHHYVRGNWTIQDGLPQISAVSIAQDNHGYLWVGTQSGLARFDGVRFVRYTPETEPGLPGIWIRSLHVAGDGKLWIGTYKGVSVYDGERFTAVPAADARQFPALEAYAFAEDAAGQLWVATSSGLFRMRGDRLHAVVGSPAPTQALLMRDGGLLMGARGAVHLLRDGRWSRQALPADAATAAINRLVAAQGRLWAATTLGLFTRNSDGWGLSSVAPALSQSPVDLLYADRDGSLWAGGDAGWHASATAG